MNKLAQIQLAPDEGFKLFGKLGLEGSDPSEARSIFNTFLSSVIGLMTIIAIIWFLFLLLSGAYAMMSAGSDKQALEGARKRISNGIIGLIVVIAGVFIIDLIGDLIGIPDILNPGLLILNILI